MKIEINSKDGCPFCEMAKEWLRSRGYEYTEILWNDDEKRQAFYDSLGLKGNQRSVPQIFIISDGDRYRVGGYSDLETSGL